MSDKRKDLLTQPNTRGFAPIVSKGGAHRATELSKGMDGDEEGGDGEEEQKDEETEKSKVKKGMPPGLAAAKEAKDGKEPDGDEGGEQDAGDGQDAQQKKDAKGKPPPFMKSDAAEVTEDDLEKSIAKLNEFVQEGSPVSRKEALLEKAQTGELSKSERDELYQVLGGKTTAAQPTVAEQITKGLVENDDLQKALDVSDYLQEQHTALVKSLGALGEHMEKSGNRQHDFNLILAKAMSDVGSLVKALSERVGGIETAPARGPKAKGVAGGKVLQKGFAGEGGAAEGERLSKSQILDGMEALLRKGGEAGQISNGESILHAISKYESTNQISKSMLSEVQKELGRTSH